MKKIIILFCFLLGSTFSYAVYSKFFPVTMTQPDGTELTCYITGDEFYRVLHDADGYTIVENDAGYLVYARLENDELVATDYIVGQIDPRQTELAAWAIISAEKREKIRRDFIEKTPKWVSVSEDDASKNKNSSTINNLVIYVRFSDQNEFAKDTTHYWEMFNDLSTPTTPSMRNFFSEMSYQKLDIPSHFYPIPENNIILSYQDIHPRSYFMPYSGSNPNGYQGGDHGDERTRREHELLARAINAVKSEIPASLDLDYNNDGAVDNVCFMIKGAPTAWNTLLWPHRWSLYTTHASINNKQVWAFNVLLETHSDEYKASVISHEMFHTLDAPDLYRYQDNTIDPVGAWDLMCANANPPQSTAAYLKWKYGKWIDNIPEITKGGTYTLYPVWNEENNIYKIASPNSSTEYFTVEYRTKNIYWDKGIPGSGLLIYRINYDINGNSQGPPDEVYIFRPGASTTTQNGNISQAAFSQNSGRTEFHDSSNPPCFLSNNAPGGIHITNIGPIGDSITFEVVFQEKPEANFRSNIRNLNAGSTVAFYDMSSNLPTSWEWEFEGGTPSVSNEKNPTVRYETEGVFQVKLTVSNQYGSHFIEKEDFIAVGDFPPVPDFEADKVEIIVGNSVKFTDLSLNSPTAWEWVFEGGTPATSQEQNPVVFYETVGTFDVKFTAKNTVGEGTIVKEQYINVLPPPTSPIANFEADKTQIEENESVVFTDLSENYPLYWEWEFEGGTPAMSEEQNPVVTYKEKGVYSVKLAVSNTYGMDEKEIKDFIVVGDLSIEKLSDEDDFISVYPNPNNGHFSLNTKEIKIGSDVEIFETTGRLIDSFTLESPNMDVDISAYPQGIYLMQIRSGASLHHVKIVKL